MRNEVEVVIKNDGLCWCFLFNELINIFREVKNNGNGNDERNRKEKSSQELFDDIEINFFHAITAARAV